MQTGYIFNFKDHGAFSPDGKVADAMPQTEIDAHNAQLSAAVVEHMKTSGCAVLYLREKDKSADGFERTTVGTWEGSRKFVVCNRNTSRNNFGARRLDLWFNFDGSVWHGVNIGDNDIVRCRRTKGGAK